LRSHHEDAVCFLCAGEIACASNSCAIHPAPVLMYAGYGNTSAGLGQSAALGSTLVGNTLDVSHTVYQPLYAFP